MLTLLAPCWVMAQEEEQSVTASEEIQVTATRIPEAVEPEPAAMTIIPGKRLIDTGAHDLPSALALVAGVSVAPGSDGGPASSVPEFWGLREFDAFLLVVDNVPWGGAFNPALATLDLNDIERVEILRGAAPVMYGATSFVGVIHVIHRSASAPGNTARADIGNYSTGGGSARVALPGSDSWKHALSGNFDAQGYKDDRTSYDRGHILYRGEMKSDTGLFHLDADLTFLRQDPASPRVREGRELTPAVPVDTNNNPSDHEQNEDRYHFVGGYDKTMTNSSWSVLGAFTHADRNIVKGFLSEISNEADPNAAGYRQTQSEDDVYLDTHFALNPKGAMALVVGADYIYGSGTADSENFDYHVNLDGTGAPSSTTQLIQERPHLEDTRNFFGLYAQMDWHPDARWLIQGGIRFNSTHETQNTKVLPGDPGGAATEEEDFPSEAQTNNRMSGTAGVSFLAWSSATDGLWLFTDYRNTFKPAAIDFGPEVEGGLLKPETAQSYEFGVKGRMFQRHFDWQASAFVMDFDNLVTATVVDGLPETINAGKERFKGFEFESEGELQHGLWWAFNYSFHSAKFTDFEQEFDGVPTQLGGKYLEMSPKNLVSGGLIYSPPKGINGSFLVNYVGDRFLNKRNTAPTAAYTTLTWGAGYRFGKNNIRFDMENATDERPPVSESELGDAQYYILPARSYRVTWLFGF